MGLSKDIIKGTIKGGLNAALLAGDVYTGGLVTPLLSGLNDNSGLIGKAAGWMGKKVLKDNARNWLSNAADKALEYIPTDNAVGQALHKMNNTAQGRDEYHGMTHIVPYKGSHGSEHTNTATYNNNGTSPQVNATKTFSSPTYSVKSTYSPNPFSNNIAPVSYVTKPSKKKARTKVVKR